MSRKYPLLGVPSESPQTLCFEPMIILKVYYTKYDEKLRETRVAKITTRADHVTGWQTREPYVACCFSK